MTENDYRPGKALGEAVDGLIRELEQLISSLDAIKVIFPKAPKLLPSRVADTVNWEFPQSDSEEARYEIQEQTYEFGMGREPVPTLTSSEPVAEPNGPKEEPL